ncbi:rRNA maturation RNase YbeY [Dethiosulfovibrio sp. F2B]|uniref:rRNA maturation RNase YbeY n=1 Tax=Dethiosulfovibrio faecalis TaxID=2720018 RepID=UPI001F171ED7|nr:rRNA maturation RNase YbeY [Dethiosulfovibrio faecalis]MCF4152080.1 rRNA maturation RNase YbeY [Dethiosulfovibrio faecalis]
MKLEIGISNDEGDPRPSAILDEEVLSLCIAQLFDEVWPQWRMRDSVSVSIATVDEETMRQLNKSYRDCDDSTDVLSFPQWEEDGVFSPPEEWTELPLGDVVICAPVVNRNAEERNESYDREMALMVFHSVLHLLGWDHDTQEKEAAMWSLQEKYRDIAMEKLGQEG